MRRDARLLQDSGADVVLLSASRSTSARRSTAELHVPVIGIGAGPDTDGQILVLYDVLDITPARKPKVVQNFQQGCDSPLAAIRAYGDAVKSRAYPPSIVSKHASSDATRDCSTDAQRSRGSRNSAQPSRAGGSPARASRSCPPWATCTWDMRASCRLRTCMAGASSPASSSTRCSSGRPRISARIRVRRTTIPACWANMASMRFSTRPSKRCTRGQRRQHRRRRARAADSLCGAFRRALPGGRDRGRQAAVPGAAGRGDLRRKGLRSSSR